MTVTPAALLLGAALLALAHAAAQAQQQLPAPQAAVQAQQQPPAPQGAVVAYLSGYTTTFLVQNPQRGPVHLSLALLPAGNGWLYSEPGPGGSLTPRLRYIYRWWTAQDGRLCYLYSPSADRMTERSLWTCWRTGTGADGVPVLLNGAGTALPVLARVRGNALEGRTRFFIESAARHNGGTIPAPQDPLTPPPP